MGAANRSRRTDTRKDNDQPNGHPATITITVYVEGEELGEIGVPQNAKLSDAGNVTYKGGIAGGWVLEGQHEATLESIRVTCNGTSLKMSEAGVHDSGRGNPTTFHGGTITLPAKGADPTKYQLKVYVTFNKDQTYSISVKAFPMPKPGERGPQVTGTLSGAFALRQPERKAA